MKILVSSCLLGIPCRYDGKSVENRRIWALAKRHVLIPICPEQMAGQPAPRPPAEICNGRVLTKSNEDVTEVFAKGAELSVLLATRLGCTHAVLKQNSPSCGCGQIYDGTFMGKIIHGDGVTTRALKKNNVTVISDEDSDMLLHE